MLKITEIKFDPNDINLFFLQYKFEILNFNLCALILLLFIVVSENY